MFLRLLFALQLVVAAIAPVFAQEIHSNHCLHGCPSGSPATNDLIVREIYILSSNDDTKLADWVAYKVTSDTIGPSPGRNWKADPLLAENETLEPEDYKDAHARLKTDRGHQAPLASFSGTRHWKDTNLLSNITPQKSDLNQGAWVDLESKVRDLARKPEVDAVYVMTGPLYERDMPKLPKADEAHMVPSGYWKIVAINDGDSAKVAGFIFDQNTAKNADFCDHLKTVDEIERKSGLNFFHGLDESRETQIESGPPTLTSGLGCSS